MGYNIYISISFKTFNSTLFLSEYIYLVNITIYNQYFMLQFWKKLEH